MFGGDWCGFNWGVIIVVFNGIIYLVVVIGFLVKCIVKELIWFSFCYNIFKKFMIIRCMW